MEKIKIVQALDKLLSDIAPNATFTLDVYRGHVTRAGLRHFRVEQSPPPSPPSPSLLAPPRKARRTVDRCQKHKDVIDDITPTVTYSDICKHKEANEEYVYEHNRYGVYCEICGEDSETMCDCDFHNCLICKANRTQLKMYNKAFLPDKKQKLL